MIECSTCGTELNSHDIRCPTCGKPTAYYHRRRRCLNCGTPVSERAKTCLMCGQAVDRLPLNTSSFSGSWLGIGVGFIIIGLIVLGVLRYQWSVDETVQAAQPATPTATATFTPTITPTPGPTDTPTPTATNTPTPTATPRTHIVESGENPSYIASLYGISLDELIALNDIEDVSSLSVGQALILPDVVDDTAGDSAEPQATPDFLDPGLQVIHVVESGDTLLGIALEYGTSTDAIQALNPDVTSDLIYPGQSLVVPLATPTATTTPTITPTSTPTPGPYYPSPNLLSPADEAEIDADMLFFNWTATAILSENDFYVLQLVWADGTYTEHWGKQTGQRFYKDERPAAGPIQWRVAVMHQTGTTPSGDPKGFILTEPVEQRRLIWR